MRRRIPFSIAATILFFSGSAFAASFCLVFEIDPQRSAVRGCAPASGCERIPVTGVVKLHVPDSQRFLSETSLRYLQGPFVFHADAIVPDSPVDLARRRLVDTEHFASVGGSVVAYTRYFFWGRSGAYDAESTIATVGLQIDAPIQWNGFLQLFPQLPGSVSFAVC